MILIADSGSTKTQWKLLGKEVDTRDLVSEGINPYFQTEQQISLSVDSLLQKLAEGQEVAHIYFYGAGCGSDVNRQTLKEVFKKIFPKAIAEINTDLLGAARSACGTEPGIAAILGTGSNSCDYDGTNILSNMPSLGYILGDEGSGAVIGKTFMQDLLNKEIPHHIENAFYEKYDLNKDRIIRSVYKEPNPNKFLASFIPFLYLFRHDVYVHTIFTNSFTLFFKKHICKYPNYRLKPLCCVGSIAFHFKDILEEVCNDNEMQLRRVIEKPIEGIGRYHSLKAGF